MSCAGSALMTTCSLSPATAALSPHHPWTSLYSHLGGFCPVAVALGTLSCARRAADSIHFLLSLHRKWELLNLLFGYFLGSSSSSQRAF